MKLVLVGIVTLLLQSGIASAQLADGAATPAPQVGVPTTPAPVPAPVPVAVEHPIPDMIPEEMSHWCWASAVQNILAQVGIEQSQSEIVARFTGGWVVNTKAYAYQVAALLRSYGVPAKWVGTTLRPQRLHDYLSSGYKVIADVHPTPMGHSLVLQGLGPAGSILTSDTYSGFSDPYTYRELVLNWGWVDSIVVQMPWHTALPTAGKKTGGHSATKPKSGQKPPPLPVPVLPPAGKGEAKTGTVAPAKPVLPAPETPGLPPIPK